MYGYDVRQNGNASATASLTYNGEIDLEATDLISTGAGSTTATPISNSSDTIIQSSSFQGGTIDIGLAGASTLSTQSAPVYIENAGLIQANHGTVSLNAQQRVFLENSSSIDVSGNWIDAPASANTTQVQLNSVELRDYPDQKNGILKGAKITVNNLLGSSIGNISAYLNTQEKTAMEQSLQGGKIYLASGGDVIEKQGASLNFSGGGTDYSSGYVTTTALVSAGKVYNIGNAPENIKYSGITSVTNYIGSYVQGADAGLLQLNSSKVVLDGGVLGKATAGVYQTQALERLDKMGNQNTLGLQAPAGGTLFIGSLTDIQPNKFSEIDTEDFSLNRVVLQSVVAPLSADFGLTDQLLDPNAAVSLLTTPQYTTYLSTQKLSSAGLAFLAISSNSTITLNAGADISLAPGLAKSPGSSAAEYQPATVALVARAIDLKGEIDVPGGYVYLTASDDKYASEQVASLGNGPNPDYVAMASVIDLEPGSEINVAGQRIDNSLAATGTGGTAGTAFIGGGKVDMEDWSFDLDQGPNTGPGQGMIVNTGSTINVSGGYGISAEGRGHGRECRFSSYLGARHNSQRVLAGILNPGK